MHVISSIHLKLPSWRVAFGLGILAAAAISFIAKGQSSAPNIPVISLSADPLYSAANGDKPVLALALSVEFPTVGAQYVGTPNTSTDSTYANTTEYIGYYDAEGCYTYNNAPTETPISPQIQSDFKRFDRSGTATNRMCDNAFSGNFLNWASNSAIDMLRLALTGGDRVIDTASQTILQRAVLPHDGDGFVNGHGFFWNSTNFPAKQLKRAAPTGTPNYYGAVPTAMATAAGSSDIWIANDLNRIYFGTAKTGNSSASASSYGLGGPTNSNAVVNPYETGDTALSIFQSNGNATACPVNSSNSSSGEGVRCEFSGTKEVLYGAPPGTGPGSGSGWMTKIVTDGLTCGNSGMGADPISGVYKKCYYRDVTTQTGSLNSDGFFYARVQVCNVDSTGTLLDSRDYGLCRKYPNGNYKPTGAIQKYSDQLRLAAFGYLMDQTDARVGGVLRAPMKYVGGKTFDITGVENTPTSGNPNKEWNEETGVFIANPDGNSSVPSQSGAYLSGVTSYVNQFGRTGSKPGRYKIWDPLSELHYEALRYLQGLQPTPAATSSITADMYDGFPAATSWVDPYGGGRTSTNDYSCLKSNIVVIGDKNTNERSGRLPVASAAGNIPDINAWSSIVQNFEKNAAGNYVDGQGATRPTENPNGANNSVPTGLQSAIMGTAYWARTHDIRGSSWSDSPSSQRPGLRVKTFMFDVNEFGQSTNDSDRRTSNQLFMAAKYGGFETDPSNIAKSPYNTWGNPFKREDGTVDKYVWEDSDTRTSRVGEANTYFLQSDARGVLSAFDDIFSRASTAARSIAGGAIQSKNLTQAGNTIYQGTFDTSDWSGDLLAIPVTVNNEGIASISTSTTWSAATQLGLLSDPVATRNIVVGNGGATANPVAAPFKWATPAGVDGISSSLRAALGQPTPGATDDGLAQSRLNYLRGDKSQEISIFRRRTKLLGDIVNSGVVYSGAPTNTLSSSTYSTFYTNNAGRTPAVFVGANDGMLHAFNANNGNELFAYIPSWLGPKLPALTSLSYASSHQSYADGTPAVAEAQVGSEDTADDWKTVLVAGTGGGGQGVFALDVTDPTAFSASKVMWEFTHADDQDMGHVVGRPQILKFRTSAYNAATATYKWFAVVGSGVNNYAVAGSSGTYGSGNPALFLLDLSKPTGTAWTLNTNYYKITLPIDATLSASKATGLINFRAALDGNRRVTQMYMGDLHGNLWKLDFTLLGTSDWNINKLSYFNKGTIAAPAPYPLYIAKDGAGNTQPISMAPTIAYGPTSDSYYVMFGTGKYLELSDKSSTSQQSVYMIFDSGAGGGDSSPIGASSISGRSRLEAGTISASTGAVSVPAFTLGRAASSTDATQRSGWYADLPTSGERLISNGTLFGSKVVFGSLITGTTTSTGSCTATVGGGNQYSLDIASGNGDAIESRVGILGEPLVTEISASTTLGASNSTGRRLKVVTSQIFQQGSSGLSIGRTATKNVVAGRLSWRQINNYQDLKNAP